MEPRTLLKEPGFESCSAVFVLGHVISLYIAPVHSVQIDYLAIVSGGHVCTNSLRVLIAAWLDDSQ